MLNLRNKNDNMAFGLNEICSYLLDVLAFRNYVEIPDNRDAYFTISNEELKTGMLKQSECREKLLKNWSKKGKEEELSVKVLLIPKIVSDMIPKYESPAIKREKRYGSLRERVLCI